MTKYILNTISYNIQLKPLRLRLRHIFKVYIRS